MTLRDWRRALHLHRAALRLGWPADSREAFAWALRKTVHP